MLRAQSMVAQLLVVASAALMAEPRDPLSVLRATPQDDAAPTSAVTVTFDRPVAGSLDRSIDPKRIFRIVPAVPGTLDWRDPVTLRFRPAEPLPAGATYEVTIAATFAAMDGSRLARPYTFTFRVRGPRVLAASPVSAGEHPRFVTPDQRFDLVVDAPVEPAVVSAAAYVELNKTCGGGAPIRLVVEEQRAVRDTDPWSFREAGGWDRDRAADRLRRVIRLAPAAPLPRGCTGMLVVPASFDERGRAELQRWEFSTYGTLQLVGARCGWGQGSCPTGPVTLSFSTPVRGADVLRHVQLRPATPFTVSDTADARAEWSLETPGLRPRTGYAVVAGTSLADVFGQRLTGNPVATFATTGYAPSVEYSSGRAIVERRGARTFALTFVNVDTIEVMLAPVPDTLEPAFLSRTEWSWNDLWPALLPRAERRWLPVRTERDRVGIYGVALPARPARPGTPSLFAVQITSPQLDSVSRRHRPISLLQVTDLGVHARIGVDQGVVWVTGASDGRPRPGATVTLRDERGRVVAAAEADSGGLARLRDYRTYPAPEAEAEPGYSSFQGYVEVTLGEDRALLGINDYDPDLSPWRFNVTQAWGSSRFPAAVALFTERGVYRPGEPLYAKAIVRTGPLGALAAAPASDSLRWLFRGRAGAEGEVGMLRDTTVALSSFGTADQAFRVPLDAGLGEYQIAGQLRRGGRWVDVASAWYRVAEYRPPEFLVDVAADSTGVRYAGDSVGGSVEARYLFGAPMGRAAVRWTLRQQAISSWELDIPGTEGFELSEGGWWYEELSPQLPAVRVPASGVDTLDPSGRLAVRLPLGETERGRPSRATFEATVTDVNRQTVSASTSLIVHPAAFYLAARSDAKSWFWTAGTPTSVSTIAVRPDGRRVPGVRVRGAVIRREWHQVRRERAGYAELVGEWVSDTVARCEVTTGATPAPCRFTPPAGGSYIVGFSARDSAGREVTTSFYRWATGKDWVPWNDESQFKMDVIPDRTRYAVGDTATVLFASPFTDAEAWITIERERLLEQRRLRIASGTTTLRLPITEAFAPNVFVSIIVARGRSAPPGPLDDPGRPTIRVGYTELRVTPETKRLAVAVKPRQPEYRPGDTAHVAIAVRDAAGKGHRSEVTLWAVDEGVLALTGFRTPDPLDLLYRPRGLGMRLASTLTTVTPQVPAGLKGQRAPGGGGGADAAEVLRSRFQTTAFFLGSVVTDSAGNAAAAAKLPDNLTTFRLMAVAVTAGDRFGSGESPLLVSRPLVARPALPRFLRENDRFSAGVVVNARSGAAQPVVVDASARGAELRGKGRQTAALEPGRGREVRFDFRAQRGDTARFRFDARGRAGGDAVAVGLPIRPDHHPQAFTVAGVLHDSATAVLTLPVNTDPARSSLSLSLGSSPLAMIRGVQQWFRIYPYWCTEQLASAAEPLLALYRAAPDLGADSAVVRRARADLERVVATLARRQRADGGIGLWAADDWTTPWLSSYAGAVLLEAKLAGLAVDDSVMARLGGYLQRSLAERGPILAPVIHWYDRGDVRLSDRVMAVDYLSRAGLRDRAAENELLRVAPQLAWEDRVRLAHVLGRGGDLAAARRLLEPAWSAVEVEGRRATLPEATARDFYFTSRVRPAAWLLSATLAVDAGHPLVGPLVETLIQQGRGPAWTWNTNDFGTAVAALADFQRRQRSAAARGVEVRAAGRGVFRAAALPAVRDTTVPLAGLLEPGSGPRVRLRLDAPGGGPLFYFVTATTAPRQAPVRPGDRGIQVERWYERYDTGKPVVEVKAGELVRVRLKVTLPSERYFVVLDDALPAGLEAVDLSLRTVGGVPGPGSADSTAGEDGEEGEARWAYGSWDAGWWSPFDHREMRDDRVVFVATRLWKGSYSATYLARATTPGTFVRPPAHAEEMYNPAVFGESDGGVFTVR